MNSKFSGLKKLIGPLDFYGSVMAVTIPIMIQNGITSFVGMLDNIMVGRVGTDAMSGVSIINQLLFVYYLCVFGGLAGIGIFTAQFWGKRDFRGMQYTIRAKLLLGFFLTAAGFLVLFFGQDFLIGMFLHEGGSTGNIGQTMHQAKIYLNVMYFNLLPVAVSNVYSSTLRETGQTVVPMKAGIAAVVVNLIGNYILIYGKFGAPVLGVAGAAIATVLSRFVELFIVIWWTHSHPDKNPYIRGCFRSFRIPLSLLKNFAAKGTPLLCNEALWSIGQTVLMQCYSVRGLTTVASLNISNTLAELFNIVFISMGNATAILLGQRMGSGRMKGVKADALRVSAFSVLLSFGTGLGMFLAAPYFPNFYKTTDEVRTLASGLLRMNALFMPLFAYTNAAYFTIRSGGKTLITFLFDCCFCWAVSVPAAFWVSRSTSLSVVWMFMFVQSFELIKAIIGFVLVVRGRWIHDLTAYTD